MDFDGFYYHWASFLQLNTITFLLPFLILSSLWNHRDLGEMTLILCLHFYLKTFCPLFIVIPCRKFWTDLFAICGNALSHQIQSPMIQYQKDITHVRVKLKQDSFWVFMEQRLKILVAATSFAPPSSKIIKLSQICFDLSQDSYIAYCLLNKVVWI